MTQEIIELSSELRMLLLILTIITIGIYVFGRGLGLIKAVMLLSLYGIFTLYIVGVSSGHPLSMEIAHFLRDIVFSLRLQ